MQTQNIIIDDGLKRFTFTNNNNEVFAEFLFNPADTSIIDRYDAVVETFNKIEIKGETSEDIENYVKELSETFKAQFDYLLNRDNRDGLFKTYSPVTVFANGDFFAEVILKQVGKIIENELNIRLQKKAKRIEKYTKKYTKFPQRQ